MWLIMSNVKLAFASVDYNWFGFLLHMEILNAALFKSQSWSSR